MESAPFGSLPFDHFFLRSADGQITGTIWIRGWFGKPGDEESQAAAADAAYKNKQGDEGQDSPSTIREEFMSDYRRTDTPDISDDGIELGTA
ncbi:hypothetical protein BJY01DRAFT_256037 [Aspergillus pseudoustus]|uniref:Uncharacterized protein n=1 Tax=Aspergillus pseudoustus TaxID=1810923 RepID=A0ABR4IEZ1_9EURO